MTAIRCLRCGSYVTHIDIDGTFVCDYCKFQWGNVTIAKKPRRKKE